MKKFEIETKPFDDGRKLYDKKEVSFEPGITVLIGCNGSGKTTLLWTMREQLKRENVPTHFIDTLTTAHDCVGNALFRDDISLAASAFCASEGERMLLGIGDAKKLGRFIETGGPGHAPSKERWILIDSADSGLSIDALEDVRNFLHRMVSDSKKNNVDLYIIISTNQYELAANERCLNVQTLRPKKITSYASYKKAIMQSRRRTDARQ